MIWSVVILSPTTIITAPLSFSGILSALGGSPILGPRKTSVLAPSGDGFMNMESSTRKEEAL